jgi:hypothetical protein
VKLAEAIRMAAGMIPAVHVMQTAVGSLPQTTPLIRAWPIFAE